MHTTALRRLSSDFDNDGWPDIFVACDSTPSLAISQQSNGTFTEMAVASGVAFNGDGHEQAGMGAHAVDYDGDGWLDIIRLIFQTIRRHFTIITETEPSAM